MLKEGSPDGTNARAYQQVQLHFKHVNKGILWNLISIDIYLMNAVSIKWHCGNQTDYIHKMFWGWQPEGFIVIDEFAFLRL